MAYVPGYEYDLFVSYARADDFDETGTDQGWVTYLKRVLEGALRMRLGGTDQLRIYFDRSNLQSNHQLAELLKAARSSAIFLAIGSRAYKERDWTKRELAAFVESTDDLRCLFAVEYLPLDAEDAYPEPLHEHKRLQLWEVDSAVSGTPMPLARTRLTLRIHDLAEQMRTQLLALARARIAQRSAAVIANRINDEHASESGKGVVVLAQTTDDLDEEAQQVRRYFAQFGYEVLPAGDYPQGGEEFVAAVAADLSRADAFVQLISARSGRHPPDLPAGHVRTQFDLAAKAGCDIVLWHRPGIDLSCVMDEDHLALFSSEHMVACGLETLKSDVRHMLERKRAEAAKKETRTASPNLVFIDADSSDRAVAKKLLDSFRENNLTAVMPMYEGCSQDNERDLKENMLHCDVLLFLYGNASPTWVRSQIRYFNKLRPDARVKISAICLGPPDQKSRDLGFAVPDLRFVDANPDWRVGPILELIGKSA